MNLERRIAKLNSRLRQSLGHHPLYSWRQAESIVHPAVVLNVDESDMMEYVCVCGVDVCVHHPSCKMTAVRKKVSIERVLSDEKWDKRWVICAKEYWNPDEWRRTFGTHVTYPSDGLWTPATFTIAGSGGHIKTMKGQEPNENDTEYVIARVRQSREMTTREKSALMREAMASRDEQQVQRNIQELKEETHASRVLNFIPGQKGHSSFQTPQRLQGPANRGASV